MELISVALSDLSVLVADGCDQRECSLDNTVLGAVLSCVINWVNCLWCSCARLWFLERVSVELLTTGLLSVIVYKRWLKGVLMESRSFQGSFRVFGKVFNDWSMIGLIHDSYLWWSYRPINSKIELFHVTLTCHGMFTWQGGGMLWWCSTGLSGANY